MTDEEVERHRYCTAYYNRAVEAEAALKRLREENDGPRRDSARDSGARAEPVGADPLVDPPMMTDEEIKRVLAEIDNLTTPSGKDEIIRRLAREVKRLREENEELQKDLAWEGRACACRVGEDGETLASMCAMHEMMKARAERAERELAEAQRACDEHRRLWGEPYAEQLSRERALADRLAESLRWVVGHAGNDIPEPLAEWHYRSVEALAAYDRARKGEGE